MSMSGWGGLSKILEEAVQRKRNEVAQRREEPRNEPRQGAARMQAERNEQRQSPRERREAQAPRNEMARIEPPREQRRRAPEITRTDNPPPLPEVRPMATPVMDLKRETANHWNFTPEARTNLYDTPTRVNYRGYDNKPPDEPQGQYRPQGYVDDAEWHGNQIMVQEPYGNRPNEIHTARGSTTWPSLSAGTLAHEFGHKWQDEQMPDDLWHEWQDRGWTDSSHWSPQVKQQWRNDRGTEAFPEPSWQTMAGETYANSIMHNESPGLEMPAWYRDKFFAGLFRDGASEWQQPYFGPPPPMSDRLRELDPMYWPDSSGRLG